MSKKDAKIKKERIKKRRRNEKLHIRENGKRLVLKKDGQMPDHETAIHIGGLKLYYYKSNTAGQMAVCL